MRGPPAARVLFQEACKGDFQIVSRDHADQTWIVQDSVDDGPVSWSSRHLPSPPCPSAPLRTMLNRRAFYAPSPRGLRAIAAWSTRQGRYAGQVPLPAQHEGAGPPLRQSVRTAAERTAPPHGDAATTSRVATAWRPQTCARRAADAAMGLLRLSLAPYRPVFWSHTGPARRAACSNSEYPSAVPPCAGLSSWITSSPRWSRP